MQHFNQKRMTPQNKHQINRWWFSFFCSANKKFRKRNRISQRLGRDKAEPD
jgi:hypothetical protein